MKHDVVAEQFLKHLVIKYGKHKVSSDMAVHGIITSLQISETKTSYIHSSF